MSLRAHGTVTTAMFRIFGPPGTGKTTKLLDMVDRSLGEGTPPQKIAFLAFTRKAAHEARDRAAARFELDAKTELPYFRTLHSLAYRLLAVKDTQMMRKENYVELSQIIGFPLSASNTVGDEEDVKQTADHPILSLLNLARLKCQGLRKTYDESNLEETWLEVNYVDEAYRAYKEEEELLDFTDLLELFLKEIPRVCPEFELCFLDEAQDLSPLQWKIAKAIDHQSKKFYVAGDDDQAIYKWAGAQVSQFINLEGGSEVLSQSYRIPRQVHALAERIAQRIENRFPKKYLPKNEEGSVEYINSIDQVDMGDGEWLVMAQANYMLSPVVEELKRMGYLFERNGFRSISDRTSLAVNGWEQLRKDKAITYESAKAIYSYMSGNGNRIARGKKILRLDAEDTVTLKDLQETHGLLVGKELIWHEALDRLPDTDKVYITSILRSGEKFNAQPRIKLSTIHGTKGGEADNVVLFTDLSPAATRHTDQNDLHRLFYVGMTRTITNLFVVEAENYDRSYLI